MANQKQTTQKTISMLLSSKSKQAKKFAGKHVLVVKNKIVPIKSGKKFWDDFDKLKNEYKETPTLTFVPRPDVSYILIYD